MKKVSLVKYVLKGVPTVKKTLLHRGLYGYTDHSNKGKYTYKRKGVLDGLEYKKISDSVLLMDTKDVDKIISVSKKYKIKVIITDLIMP